VTQLMNGVPGDAADGGGGAEAGQRAAHGRLRQSLAGQQAQPADRHSRGLVAEVPAGAWYTLSMHLCLPKCCERPNAASNSREHTVAAAVGTGKV